MNLYLHNIGDIYGNVPVTLGDALLTDPGYRVDYVLTNPPFGKKSSITFTNEEGEQEEEDLVYNRTDFWTTSSNKQLNFVQHINTILNSTGKAAVVVPDNVLFEGGVGETVRRKLLETTNLHTILRLPTGIFYKPGVKANVFFDKCSASLEQQTREVWIYDLRTNIHFTLKQHPMTDAALEDFIRCFNPENRHQRTETWSEENPDGRWRRFSVEAILERDKCSLDIFWIKDRSLADLDNLPAPDVLAADIIENLQSALEGFQELILQLGGTMKFKKIARTLIIATLLCAALCVTASATGASNVATVVESTWKAAAAQIKTVVNSVVFPALDMILAIAFFGKLAMSYFDYRKHGQFEWTGPVILFACLVFTLTAPTYLWTIVGI